MKRGQGWKSERGKKSYFERIGKKFDWICRFSREQY